MCELEKIENRLKRDWHKLPNKWRELPKIQSKIDLKSGAGEHIEEARPLTFPAEGESAIPYVIPADDVREGSLVMQDSKLAPGIPLEGSKRTRAKLAQKLFAPYAQCCADGHCEKDQGRDDTEWQEVKSSKSNRSKVMGVVTKEPSGIKAVSADEWVQIDVQVDSGATETVMAESTLSGVIDITEGPACKRGVTYEVANGEEIPNLGERKFLGYTDDGSVKAITAQVCAVNQTLMSVSKIASNGNRVVFDDDGSYIEDKTTGERTWMTQVGGMYSLKMWVSRKSTADAGF